MAGIPDRNRDFDLETLEHAPPTRWSHIVLAVSCASVTMVAAALFITIGPTEAHRAGHDAVIAKGEAWIRTEVDAAGGTALRVCDELLSERAAVAAEDYSDFIEGCGTGIDGLFGGHVPLFDAGPLGNAAR